jgi:hypothetical protein
MLVQFGRFYKAPKYKLKRKECVQADPKHEHTYLRAVLYYFTHLTGTDVKSFMILARQLKEISFSFHYMHNLTYLNNV